MEGYDSVYGTQPLRPTDIRVLRLDPALDSTPNSPIFAKTEVVSLDDSPEFTALSYCWGTGGFNHDMICNGIEMKITESLDKALKVFRLGAADSFRNQSFVGNLPSLVIWADAVCINQSDVAERNAQVQLMGRIYSQAARVFIYLGESTQFTAAGLALAGQLWNMAFEWGQKHPEMNPYEALSSMEIPHNDRAGWKGLVEILTSQWFSRCWIIQEFCLCANRIFVCGATSFTWVLLDTAVRLIDANTQVKSLVTQWVLGPKNRKNTYFWDTDHFGCLFTLRNFAGTVAPDRWLEEMKKSKNPMPMFSLWELLVTAGSQFEATNPRDKIYALMGMAADVDVLPKPDYNLSIGDTYRMFAEHWIANCKGMDVISIAGLQRGDVEMPSWVPDWSTQSWPLAWNRYDNEQSLAANASKGLNAVIKLDADSTRLIVRGAIIDEIAHLSQPIKERLIGQSESHQAWIESARKTLHLMDPNLSSLEINNILSTLITVGDPEYQNQEETSLAFAALEHAAQTYIHLNVIISPSPLETTLIKYQRYILDAVGIMAGTRVAVTTGGRIGLVPNSTIVGDEVCIFAGGIVPYLIRPKDDSHLLVGDVFIQGIMQGEAVESPDFVLREIVLA